MFNKRKVIYSIFIIVFMCGCAASAKKLRRISLGYTKDQVIEQLGEPKAVRGSIRNKYSQVVEVFEYRLAIPNDDNVGTIVGKSFKTLFTLGAAAVEFKGEHENYWLYFIEDELVQWGQAGDWSKEADRIYEIRFEKTPIIPR